MSYHFVREQVASGQLIVHHIKSEDQPADILTKALQAVPYKKIADKLITEIPMNLQGGSRGLVDN